MRVIGIAGKAGAGKNTAAGMLAGILAGQGYKVGLDSFAGDLKQTARKVLGWNGEKTEFWRRVLQEIGSFKRKGLPDHWVKLIYVRWMMAGDLECLDYLILPDVRYENEASFCREYGVLWHVVGRGGLEGETSEHSSEAGVGKLNDEVVLWNTGTVEQLLLAVESAVLTGAHNQTATGEVTS